MEDRPDPLGLTQSFGLYCETHGIFQLYQRLVRELVVAMPKDPLQFIAERIPEQQVQACYHDERSTQH